MADKKISQLTAASTPLAGTEVLPIVQSSATVKVSVADLTAGRSVSANGLTSTANVRVQYSAAGNASVVANNTASTAGATSQIIATNDAARNLRIQYTSSGGAGGAALTNGITTETGQIYTDGNYPLVLGTNVSAAAIIDTSQNVKLINNLVQGTAAKGVNFTANTPAAGMTSQLLNWYEEGTWTPVIRGSGTAGTYELSVAYGKYTRVGNQVTLTCGITLAGAVTGGGTGDLQITGMPFAKAANTSCAGAVFVSGVTFNGYLTVSTLTRASSSTLYLVETVSNTAVAQVPVSAVGVNDIIDFTLSYTV